MHFGEFGTPQNRVGKRGLRALSLHAGLQGPAHFPFVLLRIAFKRGPSSHSRSIIDENGLVVFLLSMG